MLVLSTQGILLPDEAVLDFLGIFFLSSWCNGASIVFFLRCITMAADGGDLTSWVGLNICVVALRLR